MTKRLLAMVLGGLTGPAMAATPLEELFGSEASLTIATGRAHAYRTAPAVASVITAEDLRNGGFRSVVEALRLVPGFHQGWSSSYFPNLTVRGFSGLWSGNVLVLLDGMAQSDLIMGNPFGVLGTLPLDAIDRIEVTRGPGSSVFGADAFSAVVNVITRKTADQGQVTLSGGSERTADARVLVGEHTDSADLVVSAEVMETDGHTPTIAADRLSQIDAQLGTALSLAPSAVNTARQTVGVLVNAGVGPTRGMLRLSQWADHGLGAGLLGVIDPTGSRDLQTVEGRLEHALALSERLTATLQLEVAQTRLVLDDLTWLTASTLFGDGLRIDAAAEQEILRLRTDVRFDASDRHFLSVGVGYEHARYQVDAMDLSGDVSGWTALGTSLSSMGFGSSALTDLITGYASALSQLLTASSSVSDDSGSRRLLSGYLQDEWLIAPKWSLTWGVRGDDYADVATLFSPRAVLVWTPLPEWTAKLLYGEGFRAPTLLETNGGLLPTYQGNASLVPERLRTAELALNFKPRPSLEVGLNLYRHETQDQIRQQDRGLYVEPENVGRQVGQGAEIEFRWGLTRDLQFRGWYAYQYNTDETTGEDAGYSPHHRVYGSLQYRMGQTFFNLQGCYVGDRARVAEDTREEAQEYGQLDLLIRHDLTKQVSLQLDVRNLLNGNLEEASAGTSLPQDLPLAGRSYYASIEVRF